MVDFALDFAPNETDGPRVIRSSSGLVESRVPRQRACQACRATKHRCDGDERSGISCSRCTRNERQCIWLARKPMGRKRKARPGDPPPSDTTSSSHTDTSPPLPSSTSLTSYNMASSVSFDSLADNSEHARSRGMSSASSASTLSQRDSSLALELTHAPQLSGQDEVEFLINVYYAIPHAYIPILPVKAIFLADLSNPNPFLLNVVLALASHYVTHKLSRDYRGIALSFLGPSSPLQPPGPNEGLSLAAVQWIQALLILSYLEYGHANISASLQLCERACKHVLDWGWNMIDDDANNVAFRPRTDEELRVRRLLRLSWWECWATDTMLSVTCRLKRNLDAVLYKVQIPTPNPVYSQTGCPVIWYYPLRLRALTLLIEAVSFPPCGTPSLRRQHSDQFNSLDSIITNVMLECQLAWTDCVKVYGSHEGGADAPGWVGEAAVGKEIFFMTILMLHAANVHLHHLYAMPEVNFDVKACGLTTGAQLELAFSGPALKLDSPDAAFESSAVFLPSMTKIVSASRELMSLLHHDHNQTTYNASASRLAASLSATSISPSSSTSSSPSFVLPTATCAPPILGLKPIDISASVVTEDILRHSPFCGCSQVIAAFGAALEVGTASTKWKALAAQSNFETARTVLNRLKRLWPVAKVFEAELDKCHGAVNGALQGW